MNVGFPMAASETEDRLLEKSFIRTDMICEKETSFEKNKKLLNFDWIICSGENKYKLKISKPWCRNFYRNSWYRLSKISKPRTSNYLFSFDCDLWQWKKFKIAIY